VRDISAQKEVEGARDQLTEMIVHDLRSPLTAILNSLSLLRRDLETQSLSSITEQALAVSDRSVNQMLGLVNSLLDISRLESGKLKITAEDILIQPLITELLERFQLEANTIGIILKTETSKSDLYGYLDRDKIRRVLANLVDNALKFTPAGGEVELGAARTDGEILFWVSDTGPGIPHEFHKKIFERYIQIPGTTGRRRGTGLGLAFAKLAVEAHLGRLWVEDHPLGGSIFKFSLPISSQA
jgi:signal transduction histidine kinase